MNFSINEVKMKEKRRERERESVCVRARARARARVFWGLVIEYVPKKKGYVNK